MRPRRPEPVAELAEAEVPARPISARVVVLDRQGVELLAVAGIEAAMAQAKGRDGACVIVGVDKDGTPTLLGRCVHGPHPPSEVVCRTAIQRWQHASREARVA
jgi:hypothetical protein